jgi:toxin ParE1/3/4
MPRLHFLDSAKRDIAEIAAYIQDESGDRRAADVVAEKLIAHCRRVALLGSMIGRPRDELRQGMRSFVSGNFIVFFRYVGLGTNPRERLIVVHVMRAARDIGAHFSDHTDDEIDG